MESLYPEREIQPFVELTPREQYIINVKIKNLGVLSIITVPW